MPSIAYHPEQYQSLLDDKVTKISDQFATYTDKLPRVYPSPTQHYRMRAEFRVWHEGDDLYYIMFDPVTKQKIRVDHFPPASALINSLMPTLVKLIQFNSVLRQKLFQVDFLSTLSGQIVVSMLYHKPLDETWQQEAQSLRETLLKEFDLQLIGRSRKQKIMLNHDYVIEKLNIHGRELIYKQVENSFTQPNGVINQHMLEWAIEASADTQGDLLELYCGNGNFSLALANNFERVLATEIAKPSVQSAQFNIVANQIKNVKILRMSAEEFTQAMAGVRSFRRLEEAQVDLSDYQCNTVFVDPPRSGLDNDTLSMVQGYQNIMYISCNPTTLFDNLSQLIQSHDVAHWAIFDQFPYTQHAELGVYLTRRSD